MFAEWCIECGADDPTVVVPWHDPDGRCTFVDLRANPYDFDLIGEVEQYPPLMQALRALNSPRSFVFTAKCDVWKLSLDELTALQVEIGPDACDTKAGMASYIDMIATDRSLFVSFAQQEHLLRRIARLACTLDQPFAGLECVLRPSFIDLDKPHQGFAITLYVKALGADAEIAKQRWASALNAVVGIVRGKGLVL